MPKNSLALYQDVEKMFELWKIMMYIYGHLMYALIVENWSSVLINSKNEPWFIIENEKHLFKIMNIGLYYGIYNYNFKYLKNNFKHQCLINTNKI